MPSLDGFTRPSLDSIKQVSTGALDKAKLMVGLNKSGGGSGDEDVESQRSENSGILEEVGEILCPELTFQQVRLKGVSSSEKESINLCASNSDFADMPMKDAKENMGESLVQLLCCPFRTIPTVVCLPLGYPLFADHRAVCFRTSIASFSSLF